LHRLEVTYTCTYFLVTHTLSAATASQQQQQILRMCVICISRMTDYHARTERPIGTYNYL